MCRCHHCKSKSVCGFQCIAAVSAPAVVFAVICCRRGRRDRGVLAACHSVLQLSVRQCKSMSARINLHITVGGLSVYDDGCGYRWQSSRVHQWCEVLSPLVWNCPQISRAALGHFWKLCYFTEVSFTDRPPITDWQHWRSRRSSKNTFNLFPRVACWFYIKLCHATAVCICFSFSYDSLNSVCGWLDFIKGWNDISGLWVRWLKLFRL